MKFLTRALPIAVVLLIAAGTVGFITVGHLQDEAGKIVQTTLPHLTASSWINSLQAESFVRTLLAITASDPQDRSNYEHEVAQITADVDRQISIYRQSMDPAVDPRALEELLRSRRNYRSVRQQALELAESGQQVEALALVKKSVWPAYKDYTIAGDKLFNQDVDIASAQGRHIIRICWGTRLAVAVLGILIFIGGFISSFVMMYVMGCFGSAQLKQSKPVSSGG